MIIKRFDYQELSRETIQGERKYLTPDNERLASVTTILSKTKSQESIDALSNWRKRMGESKANQIVEEASSRGTRMHKYLENYILNGVLDKPGSNPYSQQSHKMAQTIIDNGFYKISESWGTEVSLYYPGLYAGTTDYVGVWQNKPAIMDFKQSNKIKKSEYVEDYRLQLCSYAQAHNKLYGTNIKTGVILLCTADYEYQEFVVENDEFEYYSDQWWNRVEKYYS